MGSSFRLLVLCIRTYQCAKRCFDKAADNTKGKQKAEALFFKGVTLMILKDVPNAWLTFQEAVSLNPPIQIRIAKLFQQNRPKR